MTLICYPNSGEEWEKRGKEDWGNREGKWTGNRQNICDFIPEWKLIGFTWFGGCCRVTPGQIEEIRNAALN